MPPLRLPAVVVTLAVVLAGCDAGPPRSGAPGKPSTAASTTTPSATTGRTPTTTPTPDTTTPAPTKTPTSTATRRPGTTTARSSLTGDRRNAMAFAPLANLSDVTVEGSVSSWKAWSTSKVLVVAAFLDTVCDGDPDRATAQQRRWVSRALTASDGAAVVALRDQIPGSPGAAITRVLRSIGDTRTVAPDTSQGGMRWTIREQVRFMAALHAGRVVSKKASAYLLASMHPIPAHRWGLGTIGAGPFKGGWLRPDTVTRQMGIVDGYAVAIITDHVGPAVVQTDGDSAHVQQLDYLARVLQRRLTLESGRG